MPLIIGSLVREGLSFYTEAEKEKVMTEGFELTEAEIQERMELAMEEWLTSDERERIINDRINAVLERYPLVQYDEYYMNKIADTRIEVRKKFDALRSSNMDLEQDTILSYEIPEKGRNIHLSLIVSFLKEYVNALSPKYRKAEVALINELPAILNKEFGNLTSLADVPRIFFEGVGKPLGAIANFGAKLFKDIGSGVLEGLGLDLKKIWIYLIIAVIIIIVILILYAFLKSYISTKARKRAER